MPLTAAHSMALPDGASAKAPPDWVHLLPAGTFSGVDGRGPYRVEQPAEVIAASMAAGRMPIDENHATDFARTSGVPSPAQGWITALQSRADGIWGQVDWTAEGGRKVTAREYRGISPVYQHTADGLVLNILRAGLTNVPNLTLTTLHHRQDGQMKIEDLRKAMGLPADADEAVVLAAATAMHAQRAAHAAELGRIAEAVGAARDAKPDAIVTALQAQRSNASDAATMAQTVTALQTQLVQLANQQARDRATAALDDAGKAGKVISPTMREHYIARHMADPAGVQKELDAMPSLHSGGFVHTPALAGGVAVSGTEATVAAMMNIDPKKLAATRDARIAAGAQGAA